MKSIIVIFLWFLILSPIYANAEPLRAMRWYKIYWGGFYVGDVIAEIDEQSTETALRVDITSRGLAKRFTHFTMKAGSTSLFKENRYYPRTFHTDSSLRKRPRTITINYDTAGTPIEESVIPPDRRSKRAAVSAKDKINTFNPLAASLEIRHRVKYALAQGEKTFTIPIYDGRRLANYHVTIKGREMLSLNDTHYPAIRYDIKRTPLAGFTRNEYKRMRDHEPNIEIYVHDDDTMYPLKVTGEMPIGYAVIRYHKSCPSLTDCMTN